MEKVLQNVNNMIIEEDRIVIHESIRWTENA